MVRATRFTALKPATNTPQAFQRIVHDRGWPRFSIVWEGYTGWRVDRRHILCRAGTALSITVPAGSQHWRALAKRRDFRCGCRTTSRQQRWHNCRRREKSGARSPIMLTPTLAGVLRFPALRETLPAVMPHGLRGRPVAGGRIRGQRISPARADNARSTSRTYPPQAQGGAVEQRDAANNAAITPS